MTVELRDAVVVGAGPAGSTAACLLARAGCDVVLLDRAEFPRAKPCGDCLSAEAARLLARLDLLPAVEALRPARLQGWRIFGPRSARFAATFSSLGDPDPRVRQALALPRRELDHALLQAAVAAGAEVRTGARVTGLLGADGGTTGVRVRTTDGLEYALRSRLVIAADGLRSRLARLLGAVIRPARVRKLSLTTHVDWTGDAAYGAMYVGAGLCAGLAPVSEDGKRWNITVVADAERFGRAATRPREFFAAALRRLPAFPDSGIEPEELLASGPFDCPVGQVTFDGVALVGDAAGYFDPFTGQGIYRALAGAEQLAETVIPLLLAGPATTIRRVQLQPYDRAHRSLSLGPRRVQRIIHEFLDRPRTAETVIGALSRRPRAAAALLAVTGDLRPASSLLSRGLLISLLFPGRPGVG